uniref:Uncharacterized protein n=1 Tax=Alexandrium monilatum TaxID=311494 RepID=A0A7S4WIY8_9DINO|mmetsp:Transcript_90431/g.269853  ORF Transcript_90431/g.269853 Transcript_90431/m.269853 type:complete len:172 (-) Transcript_90431:58-573(-)
MSLLVEPWNKAACDRNEKERLLMAGLLKQKTREDYLLEHIGLNRNFQLLSPSSQSQQQIPGTPSLHKQRRRAPSEGASTPLRAVSDTLGLGDRQRSGKYTPPTSPGFAKSRSKSASAIQRPASKGSAASMMTSEAGEPRLRTPPADPLIQVLMKGPPLFSPNLATAASACV